MSSSPGCCFNSDAVQYKCSCGIYRPISKAYYCRHCLEIRCSNCVSHEVDSFFCPNCVENIPSAEAKHKKYRCMNCWICPSCSHTLVPRATGIQVPAPDDPSKTIPKKVYFLICGFCRWSSRDVGIPDQSTASGGWQDVEHPETDRINQLIEHYRAITLKEKYEKEKKAVRKSKYMHLVSRSTMLSAVRRRSTSFSPSIRDKDLEIKDITPAIATDEVEELPSTFYEDDLCLTSTCDITQRHNEPNLQQETTVEMHPKRMGLLIKQSKRCKVCEHNLIKPEFNPTSIKFKIQLSAYYHIPEIRVMKLPELSFNKANKIVLSLCNPTQYDLTISVFGIKYEDDAEVTADLVTPTCELKLPQRDDTAEFDDVSDGSSGYEDDPEVVVYRKANKLGFICTLTPLKESGPIKAKVVLKYDSAVTTIVMPNAEPKDPQKVSMSHELLLDLGKLNA